MYHYLRRILDCVINFVFFKQKTAYEMLISDLSSDVCSSDLDAGQICGDVADDIAFAQAARHPAPAFHIDADRIGRGGSFRRLERRLEQREIGMQERKSVV